MGLVHSIDRAGIKYHLMVWFSLLFALVIAVAGWIIFSLVQDTIEKNLQEKLAISAGAMKTSINTAADVSIRNHLRAVAEKNREILEHLHGKVENKKITLEAAKKQAEEILLGQKIGETGYIYVITNDGVIAVHPNAQMRNRNISYHWLARKQKEEKEGYLEYSWKNPGETIARQKALYMTYFPSWDWIISVSSYRSEFVSLINISDFRHAIESFHLGISGNSLIISGTGEVILQPAGKVEQAREAPSTRRLFLQKIVAMQKGEFVHHWQDAVTGEVREQLVHILYLPEYDWIIVSTVFLEEVYRPLERLRKVILLTLIYAVFLILPLSLYLAGSITKPLARLTQIMNEASKGAGPVNAEEGAKGEIGILAKHFNRFIKRLHESGLALKEEVHERTRAEQQLKLFAKVFENALEGISITDAEGTIVAVNQAFTEITGYQEGEAVGSNPRILKSDKHDPEFYANMWQSLKEEGHWSGEIWNRRRNGEAYPEILSISSINNSAGEVTHYVAVFHDITDMKTKEEQIKYQAYHDALTGLPNRALANDRLKMSLANARRKETNVAVFFMDLDNFKNINDSLGHAAGDILLQKVGRLLAKLVREEDTVARLGGDEFQVIGVNIASVQQVANLANRIVSGFSRPFRVEGHELFVTISIGAAIFPQDGSDAETLTKNADTAMYQAKLQGKNTFSFFTQDLSEKALGRLQLEAEMRAALQRDEFTVFYQPKVDPESGRIVSVEALIRWQKTDGTLVSPADFIPLAEETGLITALGDFVLSNACETVEVLAGVGCGTIKVAVNLSPFQFEQPDLVENIMDLLDEKNVPASLLELEITETTMMTNLEDTVAKLHLLVDEGVSISIDDFGTGYSSLYYLKVFPISALKIDRSFIKEITNDSVDAQIVETIILMADNLGIEVVAEGVETEEQLELLRRFGCKLVQGYYYSRPLPLEELIAYIRKDGDTCLIT